MEPLINELQKDSNYVENWIPESIKDSIKSDMLPNGYKQDEHAQIKIDETHENSTNEPRIF